MNEYKSARKLIEDGKRDEMAETAMELFMYFQEFVKAGFTEKQALELMKTVIAANAGNVKGEN